MAWLLFVVVHVWLQYLTIPVVQQLMALVVQLMVVPVVQQLMAAVVQLLMAAVVQLLMVPVACMSMNVNHRELDLLLERHHRGTQSDLRHGSSGL